MEKRCSKCGKIKPASSFNKSKKCSLGLHPWCRDCNKEYCKGWNKSNFIKTKEKRKRQREANSEKYREYGRAWYRANKERVLGNVKKWQEANPTKALKYKAKHQAKKLSTPSGNLNYRISHAIYLALRNNKAGRHWESLVGYTLQDLMEHIEKQFQPGMSWENMGEWHIDHIIPKSSFNFRTPKDIDFKKCWALKNLQPLWAKENLSKFTKLNKPFQPSFAFGGHL